jgi:hypothetical protein
VKHTSARRPLKGTLSFTDYILNLNGIDNSSQLKEKGLLLSKRQRFWFKTSLKVKWQRL